MGSVGDGISGHDQIHHTGTQLFEEKSCEYVDIPVIKSKRIFMIYINVMDEYDENDLVDLVEKHDG